MAWPSSSPEVVPVSEVPITARKIVNKQRTRPLTKSLDPDDDERTAISKKISWILRHGAKKVNVKQDENKWVKISDLCEAEVLKELDMSTIMQVIVDSNGKKLRYEIKEHPDGPYIRAYKKPERKALESATGPTPRAEKVTETSTGLRQEAPDFIPQVPIPQFPPTPTAAVMPQMQMPQSPMMGMGYPWPGFGFPPMMMPFMNPFMAWPQQAMVPPGKYQGRIKSFNSEKGFGFIECPQTSAQFNRDVFLHKAQIGDLTVGSWVQFSCEVNKQGMPQAKELQPLGAAPPMVPPLPGQNSQSASGKAAGKGGGKDKGKSKGGKKGGPTGGGGGGGVGAGGAGAGKGGGRKSKKGGDASGEAGTKPAAAAASDAEANQAKPAEPEEAWNQKPSVGSWLSPPRAGVAAPPAAHAPTEEGAAMAPAA